jgi:hypothetical protein
LKEDTIMKTQRSNLLTFLEAAWMGIFLVLAVPPASAQSEAEKLLIHVPPNKEGMVTREAYMKQAEAAFDTMDKDKKAAIKARSGASDKALQNLLLHVGPDQEGMVQKQKYMKHMGRMWNKADKAKRGMMAEDTYRQFVEQLTKP